MNFDLLARGMGMTAEGTTNSRYQPPQSRGHQPPQEEAGSEVAAANSLSPFAHKPTPVEEETGEGNQSPYELAA